MSVLAWEESVFPKGEIQTNKLLSSSEQRWNFAILIGSKHLWLVIWFIVRYKEILCKQMEIYFMGQNKVSLEPSFKILISFSNMHSSSGFMQGVNIHWRAPKSR